MISVWSGLPPRTYSALEKSDAAATNGRSCTARNTSGSASPGSTSSAGTSTRNVGEPGARGALIETRRDSSSTSTPSIGTGWIGSSKSSRTAPSSSTTVTSCSR